MHDKVVLGINAKPVMICVTQHWLLIKCLAPVAVLAAFMQCGVVHAPAPVALKLPGVTSNAYSNALKHLTSVTQSVDFASARALHS